MKTEKRVLQILNDYNTEMGDYTKMMGINEASYEDIATDVNKQLLSPDPEFDFKSYVYGKGFDQIGGGDLYVNNSINSSFKFLQDNKVGFINLDCMDDHIELNKPTSELRAIILFESLNIK